MSESEEGILLGTVSRYFEPGDKVDFVRDIALRQGLTMDDVVAVGDSRSDIPLFETVGFAIALNATPDARRVADTHVETSDLRDVVPLIQSYFGSRAPALEEG